VLLLISYSDAISSSAELIPDEYVLVFSNKQQAAAFATEFDSQTQSFSEIVLFQLPKMATLSGGAVDSQKNACELIKSALPAVRICEPNYIFRAAVVPNDPLFSQLTALQKIDAPRAWSVSTGSPKIVVAVVDTGIDPSHTDLKPNLWVNPGTHFDPEGKGFYGVNLISQNYDTNDLNGHGTHVAGIIGAVGNNGLGIAGVAWQVSLMTVTFLNQEGYGTLFNAIRAIDYAVENGAHIINASWGSAFKSQALKEAIERANRAGVTVVAASGNSSNNNDEKGFYPASYEVENVISVAALNTVAAALASYSNFGSKKVHLAAPGTQILSTWPGQRYKFLDGTSMAAPFVSGALAVLSAALGEESPQVLRNRILAGQSLESLKGIVSTSARLNIWNSLQAYPSEPIERAATLDVFSLRRGLINELSKTRSLRRRRFLIRLEGSAFKDGDKIRVDMRSAGKKCTLAEALINNGSAEIKGHMPAGLRGRIIFRSAHRTRTLARVRTRPRCKNGTCSPVVKIQEGNFADICKDLRERLVGSLAGDS
jgi:subtilisin family serine protease